MIYGLSEQHYQDLARIFSHSTKIDKVLIFGSRAKNTARENSDFDLAIIAPTMTDDEFTAIWNELDQLPLIFKLDVMHWDRLNNLSLKEKIRREGQLFYPLTSSHPFSKN